MARHEDRVMGWRVEHRERTTPEPGKFVVRVSSAERSFDELVIVWEGPGEPPERKPDSVKLHVREPAPIPYLDN